MQKIDLEPIGLAEVVFKDPADPANQDKWRTKYVDLYQFAHQFKAIEENYPGEDMETLDKRLKGYIEVIRSVEADGVPIPPQTEWYILRLKDSVYKAVFDLDKKLMASDEVKKKAEEGSDLTDTGSTNSSIES